MSTAIRRRLGDPFLTGKDTYQSNLFQVESKHNRIRDGDSQNVHGSNLISEVKFNFDTIISRTRRDTPVPVLDSSLPSEKETAHPKPRRARLFPRFSLTCAFS